MSMTLGEKLAVHRKVSGLTQQQLGESLNVSAQAVSKWENDLAEPDLTTCRKLAALYNISLDELLSAAEGAPEGADADTIAQAVGEVLEQRLERMQSAIGSCVGCGIAVTEDNLGTREPKVLCRTCYEKQRQQVLLEQRRREEEKEGVRRRKRGLRTASFVVGALAGVLTLVAGLVIQNPVIPVPLVLVAAVMMYTFIASLFFEDSPVQEVVFGLAGRSVHLPGLIFTWDIDGFIWLITMKLTFWVLGILGAIAFFLLGVAIGLLISPFTYPFSLARWNREIRSGED